MGLFKPDLYRNFGIGFLVGALVVGAMAAKDWKQELSGTAYAATAQEEAASK